MTQAYEEVMEMKSIEVEEIEESKAYSNYSFNTYGF